MRNLPTLLKKTEFRFFLFWAAIIAFNWPFLTIPAQFPGAALLLYILAAWLILIPALILLSLALDGCLSAKAPGKRPPWQNAAASRGGPDV